MISFYNQTLPSLKKLFSAWQEKEFRANQVYEWVYKKGARSFDEMTNLSKSLREKLTEHISLKRSEITSHQLSQDGTQKWLLRFEDGNEVETVFIPDRKRGTLCISSQIGCTLTCKFCHTGTQRLVRNLTSGEILTQILVARDHLNDWQSFDNRKLTNIVLMGMGEPLFNYSNIATAMKILMDDKAMGWSKRRITLSTSGVVPAIEQCGKELGVNLAISLHAPNDELRTSIMPINNKYKLKELIDACRNYPGMSDARRITFEYVMLDRINDEDHHAKELIALIQGLPAKVNIIPFNPWPGSQYKRSSMPRIRAFARILEEHGLEAPIRTPRGEDILAACGQLKSESERKSRKVFS
jgi:23S rRNA (adenine2503-C2)-methyltransferase